MPSNQSGSPLLNFSKHAFFSLNKPVLQSSLIVFIETLAQSITIIGNQSFKMSCRKYAQCDTLFKH